MVSLLPLVAQDYSGTISGIVRDLSGAVIADAKVTARHTGTGEEAATATLRDGRYVFQRLAIGTYQVLAARDGFKSSRHPDVLLQLDRAAIVDFHLVPGDLRESVVVTGEARQIEATASALTSLVDRRTIENLPLDGRDYIQLATLQAGVVIARASDRDVDTGYGVQLSISGSRPFQNSVRVDGLVLTTYNGTTPASINGLNMGVDATAEFSVHGSAHGAQYGQAGGGLINVVTKSGTNELHGTAFYFHRNDNLDARNFFDGASKPEFRRHQFGASLGGPIRRNRTFFFTNYEALREQRGVTTLNTTVSANARRGQLSSGPITVDPNIARILAFYPLPNGEVFGDTGIFSFANPVVSNQNFVTTRIDHNLSDFDRLFLRHTWDGASRDNFTDYAAGRRHNTTRNHSTVLEATHIFSPRLLNAVRAGFLRTITRDGATQALVPGLDDPALAAVPGSGVMPVLIVTGLNDFPGGTNAGSNDQQVLNSYQLSDDATFTQGRHSLKFGARVERTHFNSDSQNRPHGDFRFAGVSQLLRNLPNRFRAQLPGSDTVRTQRQWIGAVYFQDSFRLNPRLTFDLGVRWEAASVPTEKHGKVANLDRLTDTRVRIGDPLFDNPSLRNFLPRAGLAFDTLGNGKLLLRAGYGIYADLILTPYITFSGSRNPPFFTRGEVRVLPQGAFPKGGYPTLVGNPIVETAVERLPRDLKQPYVQQWNLNLEYALDPTTLFRAAYAGSHGVNLSAIEADANLAPHILQPDGRIFFPASGVQINPAFGQIRNRIFDAHSFYHGLQTSFQRRLRTGLQTQINYTWAKSIDDSSNFFTSSESSNRGLLAVSGNPKIDRGLSGHDVRHAFSANAIWELPLRHGPGWRTLFGGWQAASIVSLNSGIPTTAWLAYDAARSRSHQGASSIGQRPDLAPNARDVVLGLPERWVDITAFRAPQPGYLGNLGRNTLPGPNLRNVDFSAVKRIPLPKLGDQATLDLRFEFFNLFNHANFDLPTVERMETFTSPTTVREDFSRITSAGPSREIQFGLKVRF